MMLSLQNYITGKQCHTDSKTVYIASTTNSSLSRALVQVEGYAIYHYSNVEGWPCALHAEGATFSAMFSLLMWDVIFASGVPDVFRAPYQVGTLLWKLSISPYITVYMKESQL